jgi:predicted tellurium resistance membrane protein TerC
VRWCRRLARSEGTKSFALLIGAALIAGGFGLHFPEAYIYAAVAFSGAVEGHIARRRRRQPPK